MAKEKELNKWCSLKKTVQYRPAHVEANEVRIYEERGRKIDLKRKIFPSLFTEEKLPTEQVPSSYSTTPENEEISLEADVQVKNAFSPNKIAKKNLLVKVESNQKETIVKDSNKGEVGKKTKKKRKTAEPSDSTMESQNVKLESSSVLSQELNSCNENETIVKNSNKSEVGKKTKKKRKTAEPSGSTMERKIVELESSSVLSQELNDEKETQNESFSNSLSSHKGKKNKKKKRKAESTELSNDNRSAQLSNQNKKRKSQFKNDNNPAKKRKTNFNNKSTDMGISDSRLKAYGLNPKKFKNKLKYKKQDK